MQSDRDAVDVPVPEFVKSVNPLYEDKYDFGDPEPPYRAVQEETREAERDLERKASGGHTADEALGSDGKPLVVGDVATVVFGVGKKSYPKTGTLLAVGGGVARVRLKGAKDPIGDAFPHSRVSTAPINGGKPLKTKGEKKTAADHALHVKEYEDALKEGRDPRPSERIRPCAC